MQRKTKAKNTKAEASGSTPPKVILSSRHVINTSAAVDAPTDETEDKKVESATPLPSKPKIIVPISDISPPKTKTATHTDKPTTAPELASQPEMQAAPAKAEPPVEEKASTPEQPEELSVNKPDTPKPEEAKPEEQPSGPEETEDSLESNPEDKPNKETAKALKDAEEAAERNKKLEQSIENREYFVPINAVAQKRSIKSSAIMTFIIFLLALVLIDMMLDTGTILLIQKVPHTHFFTTSSNNN